MGGRQGAAAAAAFVVVVVVLVVGVDIVDAATTDAVVVVVVVVVKRHAPKMRLGVVERVSLQLDAAGSVSSLVVSGAHLDAVSATAARVRCGGGRRRRIHVPF